MLIFNANQLNLLQEIFVIVLILYSILAQDYITKGKTIKNLNIKKCDKNYCTHSRIRIALFGLPSAWITVSKKGQDFDLNERTDLKNNFCYCQNHFEQLNYFLFFPFIKEMNGHPMSSKPDICSRLVIFF